MSLLSAIKYNVSHPAQALRRTWMYVLYGWRFKEYHWNDDIKDCRDISCHNLEIEKHVRIGRNARIQAIETYNDKTFKPILKIRENVSIQQNCHITFASEMVIGSNTAIAANVTITDIIHPYDDIDKPVEAQDIIVKSVVIGKDCKIYNGAVILPGTNIGNHCVVGANSVVNKSIPDYCIVAGNPSKIIKRYDFSCGKWLKTDTEGNFISQHSLK